MTTYGRLATKEGIVSKYRSGNGRSELTLAQRERRAGRCSWRRLVGARIQTCMVSPGKCAWGALLASLLAASGCGSGGQDATVQVEAAPQPEPVSVAEGEACRNWAARVCSEAGATSPGCEDARAAARMLPASACAEAMDHLPATIAKLESARAPCRELVKGLCADLGPQTDSCALVRKRTPQMNAGRCEQLLAQYDAVLAELRAVEARSQPLSAKEAAAQTEGDRPGFGPEDAPVTVAMYSDFECPFCEKAADTVHRLKEAYGDEVKFVFRQFPLPMHPQAPLAAEASLAAHAQGKFWPFHDKLFAHQTALARADLERYAKEVGLDLAKFQKALDEHTYADDVLKDVALGNQIGVLGTPTMIVGRQRVEDATDYPAISALIDEQLAAEGE